MESRMLGNGHVRFGERDGRDRRVKALYGAPVPTPRNPEPSREDIRITRQLVEAGKLMGVPVHDHIIIAENGYTSLAERGLLGS